MRIEEFKNWLFEVDKRNAAQTRDHISRVKRVEKVFSIVENCAFDVDEACAMDACDSVLQRLSVEARKEMPDDVNLPHDTMGISRIKSSLRKYIEFYKWDCEREHI